MCVEKLGRKEGIEGKKKKEKNGSLAKWSIDANGIEFLFLLLLDPPTRMPGPKVKADSFLFNTQNLAT